jgi:hypothetical protein
MLEPFMDWLWQEWGKYTPLGRGAEGKADQRAARDTPRHRHAGAVWPGSFVKLARRTG